MSTYKLHSASQSILNACPAHIMKVEPNNQDYPCDKLWLTLPNVFNNGNEEIYLTVSPLKRLGGTEFCSCIVHKIIAGTHTVLSDLSSAAAVAVDNAVAYIKCLSNFKSEPTAFPPENLVEDLIRHLSPDKASLILFGGALGAGKTTTALELVDFVIDEGLYQSDNVLVLNNEEDFSVLLENISVGRVRKPSLVIFDELQQAGDMFAVSTLLAANCSVLVVTSAQTFSGMIAEVLEGLEGYNLAAITDEIKTYLVYMVLHTASDKESGTTNNYSTMTALNNRGLNLFDVISLNGNS